MLAVYGSFPKGNPCYQNLGDFGPRHRSLVRDKATSHRRRDNLVIRGTGTFIPSGPVTKLLMGLLLSVLLGGPSSAVAKLITVEPIPPAIPEGLPFGETLREIRIEGNKYTREWIILTAIKSQIGHPFTQENAKLDVLWVLRLGAFTSVTLGTEPVDDGIALIVTVAEGTPYIPSISLRLTQENGIEIGPAVSSSNLLGTAARASAYARWGGATNYGFRYADPPLPGRSWIYGYKFEYFHRDRINELMNFNEISDEIFFEFLQSTTDDTRLGTRFRYLALKSDLDGMTLGADNFDRVPSLGLFVQHDSRNAIYPTDGWYMDLEVAKWGGFGGSDADFWRLDLDVRNYWGLPFLGDRHSMTFSTYASLANGELGGTIPPWAEFYIGGTNSVRGWTLGSRQGQHQWLNTVEYWFQLMEQRRWKFWFIKMRLGFQIGAFYDAGTAWSGPEQIDTSWIAGGGVGLRLTLPVVTMIRLDLAIGEQDQGIRFFIGGAEKAIAQKSRVR